MHIKSVAISMKRPH